MWKGFLSTFSILSFRHCIKLKFVAVMTFMKGVIDDTEIKTSDL